MQRGFARLDIPVAILAPEKAVERARRIAEAILFERGRDLVDRGVEAQQDPFVVAREQRGIDLGLKRRGFADDRLKKLRSAYRYLMQSKLNTSQAIARIEQEGALKCPEVDNLVDFIRTASRGVILRRSGKKADETEE